MVAIVTSQHLQCAIKAMLACLNIPLKKSGTCGNEFRVFSGLSGFVFSQNVESVSNTVNMHIFISGKTTNL